jgi:hypothetical protein
MRSNACNFSNIPIIEVETMWECNESTLMTPKCILNLRIKTCEWSSKIFGARFGKSRFLFNEMIFESLKTTQM